MGDIFRLVLCHGFNVVKPRLFILAALADESPSPIIMEEEWVALHTVVPQFHSIPTPVHFHHSRIAGGVAASTLLLLTLPYLPSLKERFYYSELERCHITMTHIDYAKTLSIYISSSTSIQVPSVLRTLRPCTRIDHCMAPSTSGGSTHGTLNFHISDRTLT
ncbi:hypothetical protein P691DRAFT_404414 [Macrolepiota fuliginosa MF-IS2]|uniref:Uncharacterized protein n=1 Tax=Macrolepiota fuliginosa MF-IS2 TaxID=1400762 RepID=A0A9P5XKZ7_9AGAR|nr:hypothetical protein P691DRAFT_404414 [Macrolepiota fuliginosa MF-IS2]